MKNEIRKQYIAERNSLSAGAKANAGKIISERIFALDAYKKADTVFIYISMKNEAPTAEIIEKAYADGKRVAVPIALKNHEMYFVPIERDEELVKTKFGVMEPQKDRSAEIIPDENSLFVVPGVAFGMDGHRMGYGGGYYDTYIDKYKIENTVAIAFDIQLKDEVPFEEHDKIMKTVITENRITGGIE